MLRTLSFLVVAVLILTGCTRSAASLPAASPVPTAAVALPSLPPVQTYFPPTRAPGTPIASPTPNAQMILPTFTPLPPGSITFNTPTPGPLTYTVQAGDYPGQIASQFGVTLEELLAANNLGEYDIIYPGDVLLIPTPEGQAPEQAPLLTPVQQAAASSDYFKIIPDSELVYSPLGTILNVEAYVEQKGGYLAYYTQDVDGVVLSGAQIVERIATDYSVSPRLLLAVLEYRSQWVTNPNPAPSTADIPIGYVDDYWIGLYRQLAWTADKLNQGFYRWREGKVSTWRLADGTLVTPQPGINPGTAGVQNLFAYIDDQATWQIDTGPNGLYATYAGMFGYPFDWAIEPLLPANLTQPAYILPFAGGESWYFTGGPHGGWGGGAAWAALDFAPPDSPIGCSPTPYWVTAVTDGLVIRSENGVVVQDLDGDGLEQTGWSILYLHVASEGRVTAGTFLRAGEKIGHPSCEGGYTIAAHIHVARKYNGMWIAADEPELNFTMDGYTVRAGEVEYDGWLYRGGAAIEAWDGPLATNQVQR
jgi:LysM repeat protein